jgi:Domain of unknown function (DUF4340)
MKQSTGIVFLVALVLAAFVYFYEVRRKPASEASTETSKPAFTLTSNDVKQIKIQHAGASMDFERKSDGWYMTQPRAQRAETSALDGLASTLSSVSVERTFPNTPDNLNSFGLKDPALTLDFTLNNGASHDVRFGSKDFSASSIYALIDNGKDISLMADSLYSNANKAPDDFRDHSLTTVAASDANFFDLVNSSGEVSGTKKDNNWTLAKPRPVAGDHGKIDALLSAVGTGQITKFVSDNNASLAKYGLDNPAVRFQAKLADGKSVQLAVGKKEGSDHYARDLSRPGVFEINDNLYSILSDKYIDLRDKQIVHLMPDDVTRADVRNLNGTFACVKGSGSGLVLEQAANKAADGKAAAAAPPSCPDVIGELGEDQADEVYDTPPASVSKELAKPAVQITITDKNGKKTQLVFSGVTGDSIYARSDASPAVFKFAKRVFDEVNFKQPQ